MKRNISISKNISYSFKKKKKNELNVLAADQKMHNLGSNI